MHKNNNISGNEYMTTMRKVIITNTAIAILCIFVGPYSLAADDYREMAPKVTSGPVLRAEVLEVYEAQDGAFRFRAYMIEWEGKKVIVSDSLGTTDHKKGSRIAFIVQKTDLPGKEISALAFLTLDSMR